jgi:hypothetical protein
MTLLIPGAGPPLTRMASFFRWVMIVADAREVDACKIGEAE